MNRSSVISVFLGCSICVLAGPAAADTHQALQRLLYALHENGTIDTDTYELIRKVARDEANVIGAEGGSISGGSGGAVANRSISGPDYPDELPADEQLPLPADAGHIIEIGGRMHIDAASIDEDAAPHTEGTRLRRVTFDLGGRLAEDWGWKFQYDFTDVGDDGLSHAWIDYSGFDSVYIRAGHVKEPYSMDNMGSSNYTTFMERGLPRDAFSERRNLGVRFSTFGDNWSATGGVFGEGEDVADGDEDEGYGFSGRLTYAPILQDRRILHLGGSYSYRATGSDDALRFRARPENRITNTYLADTGLFAADDYMRSGLEASYIHGSLAFIGEYMRADVNREGPGMPDLDFDGYYLEGSWYLTGEQMNYRHASGTIGQVRINNKFGQGGWGAIQLAARFSHLDLTDADINGGVERNLTLDINWYPLLSLRFSANYIRVLDVIGGPQDGDEPAILAIRGQMAFCLQYCHSVGV